MYRTVRHGENSLQYTILPQQDDMGSCGGAAATGVVRRNRKSGGGRLKLALVLGVAFVLAAGAVTTAVLVPLMIPRPHGNGHRALTRHHHPPQNLLPARRPSHPAPEDALPLPLAAAQRVSDGADLAELTTEDPAALLASSVSPDDDGDSSAPPSEAPPTEPLPSSPPPTSPPPTTTSTTTTAAPTTSGATAAAVAAASAVAKTGAESTAGPSAVTEAMTNGTDGGGDGGDGDDDDGDGLEVAGVPADEVFGHSKGRTAWLEPRWPFADPSAYFEWAGFNREDSVLLPLALAAIILGIVIIIAICYGVRRCRHRANRRLAFGKMSNELQTGDKATLLPDGSEDE